MSHIRADTPREPLVGFRSRRWDDEAAALRPIWTVSTCHGVESTWDSHDVNRAECVGDSGGRHEVHGRRGVPDLACSCGFDSYDSLAAANHHLMRQTTPGPAHVLGAVQIWGTVIVGKVRQTYRRQGMPAQTPPGLRYRSEFARVIALCDWPSPKLAIAASEKARIPLIAARHLEVYAREMGHQMSAV